MKVWCCAVFHSRKKRSNLWPGWWIGVCSMLKHYSSKLDISENNTKTRYIDKGEKQSYKITQDRLPLFRHTNIKMELWGNVHFSLHFSALSKLPVCALVTEFCVRLHYRALLSKTSEPHERPQPTAKWVVVLGWAWRTASGTIWKLVMAVSEDCRYNLKRHVSFSYSSSNGRTHPDKLFL